jgi:predicted ATPase
MPLCIRVDPSYLAVVIEDVPTFAPHLHNELRRLIHLADVMYDLRCTVLLAPSASSAAGGAAASGVGISDAEDGVSAPASVANAAALRGLFGPFAPPRDAPAASAADCAAAPAPAFKGVESVTSAPIGTLSAAVEDASLGALRMGARRALSRLVEMHSRGAERSFDTLSRDMLRREVQPALSRPT